MKPLLISAALTFIVVATYAQWSYNGSYVYYNGGNVGIGTDVPSNVQGWHKVLDVKGYHSKILASTDGGVRVGMYAHPDWAGPVGAIGTETNHNLLFNTNYDPKMVLTTGGNFGVGILTPYSYARLHAKSVGANPWGVITEAVASDRIIALGHDGNTGVIATSYLVNGGWSPLEFRTQNIARLTVAVDGSVGVGTSAPVGLLEVKGPYNGNSQVNINTTSSSGELRFSDNGVPKGFVWYGQGGNYMAFGRGSASNSMFVTASGDFGIGTTTPDYKLTVNGNIHAKEVKVDLSVPGPDYIFEPDYQLTSLEELKQYIVQNKHLPEVPSAKEMETNGINLMEMNVLLLKKVEELTLYQIRSHETIRELSSEINKLKAQLTELRK